MSSHSFLALVAGAVGLSLMMMLAVPGSARADQLLQFPGGGTCWVNDVGYVWGCTRPASSPDAHRQQLQQAYKKGVQDQQLAEQLAIQAQQQAEMQRKAHERQEQDSRATDLENQREEQIGSYWAAQREQQAASERTAKGLSNKLCRYKQRKHYGTVYALCGKDSKPSDVVVP